MATRGDVATAVAAGESRRRRRARIPLGPLAEGLVFVGSIAAALLAWQLISVTGVISETDLPSMTATFSELWSLMHTSDFWIAFGQTVRGWALGLAVATVLAVPLGILLGSSDFAGRAFRVPVEFLRPIPSAALIPLLFLTLGTTLKSEVFLAAFGAFWPLLIQTIYGVRDVDPLAMDTGRSFGLGRLERLYRIKLPSSVPYIATGIRISSTVSLILAFTAELFMGVPGLGQKVNFADSYGLTTELYAYAVATGFLGVAIHLAVSALERRALRWHPSQREATA
jgi:ABC-type nitrate/sulfonate/bicarbonate transport system permease component